MKRFFVLVISGIIMLLLTACGGFSVNIADDLVPPKPFGELYDIQQALEKYVNGRINLVYPSSGDHRSAIITKDLNSDGKTEAFSFYSTNTDDNTTVMHINYICWSDVEGWVSVSDIEVNSSGVESVEFAELDHSGIPKIIVSWSRFLAVDKQVSVYEINSGILSEVTSADYSVYSTCDFDKNGIYDIVAVRLDTKEKTAVATLLTLTESGFTGVSSCRLDGNVTSYSEPIVSTFTDGTPAIFIDAAKSTGMITEALYITDKGLVNAFLHNESLGKENTRTLRAASIPATDFNGDGSIDIPLTERLPVASGASESDSVYITTWNSFDGKKFAPIDRMVINYTDGYYITIPEEWLEVFTITRNTDLRQRTVVRWNSDEQAIGEEILRLQVLDIKDYEGNIEYYEGYFELTRTTEEVYIARLGNSALNPGVDYVKNNFYLIDEEVVNAEIKNVTLGKGE